MDKTARSQTNISNHFNGMGISGWFRRRKFLTTKVIPKQNVVDFYTWWVVLRSGRAGSENVTSLQFKLQDPIHQCIEVSNSYTYWCYIFPKGVIFSDWDINPTGFFWRKKVEEVELEVVQLPHGRRCCLVGFCSFQPTGSKCAYPSTSQWNHTCFLISSNLTIIQIIHV